MPIGGGKYDEVATLALDMTESVGIALLVIGGRKGAGFSVVTSDPRIVAGLPGVLRAMADGIEEDIKAGAV